MDACDEDCQRQDREEFWLAMLFATIPTGAVVTALVERTLG